MICHSTVPLFVASRPLHAPLGAEHGTRRRSRSSLFVLDDSARVHVEMAREGVYLLRVGGRREIRGVLREREREVIAAALGLGDEERVDVPVSKLGAQAEALAGAL